VASPLGKLFAADGQYASLEQASSDHHALLALPAEPNLLTGVAQRPSYLSLALPGVFSSRARPLCVLAGSLANRRA
jgi:hypothetical protein